MLKYLHHDASISRQSSMDLHAAHQPLQMPDGFEGPFVVPGTGRLAYWTGRVAIGLRHEVPAPDVKPALERVAVRESWLQRMVQPRHLQSSMAH